MKIHLLSDLHLESGPYEIPPHLQCDVIVAAGDIGVGTQGIEWLKTLDKPVIYVLGNHEYWTKKESPVDMALVLDNIKACAAGSNVHVLENEFAIIHGVRFFGATFWTNLGQFNTTLIDEAHHMNDNVHIYCQSLYEDEVFLSRFIHCAKRYCAVDGIDEDQFLRRIHDQYVEQGRFHPFVGYLLNQTSWDLIRREILLPYGEGGAPYSQTVIVTHHHPSYESLRLDGVPENEIFPKSDCYTFSLRPNGLIYKAAAYASDLSLVNNFDYKSKEPKIAAWLCGHLHRKMDYAHDGSRIVCNPRGRYLPPLTEKSARAYALFGLSISQESIEESQRCFAEDPFRGDGFDFEADLVIDLNDGITPLLKDEIDRHVPELQQWHTQIKEFATSLESDTGTVADALKECIETRTYKFVECLKYLEKFIETNTNESVQFASALLTYGRLQYYVLNDLEPPGLREETKEIIAEQSVVIQRVIAFCSE